MSVVVVDSEGVTRARFRFVVQAGAPCEPETGVMHLLMAGEEEPTEPVAFVLYWTRPSACGVEASDLGWRPATFDDVSKTDPCDGCRLAAAKTWER